MESKNEKENLEEYIQTIIRDKNPSENSITKLKEAADSSKNKAEFILEIIKYSRYNFSASMANMLSYKPSIGLRMANEWHPLLGDLINKDPGLLLKSVNYNNEKIFLIELYLQDPFFSLTPKIINKILDNDEFVDTVLSVYQDNERYRNIASRINNFPGFRIYSNLGGNYYPNRMPPWDYIDTNRDLGWGTNAKWAKESATKKDLVKHKKFDPEIVDNLSSLQRALNFLKIEAFMCNRNNKVYNTTNYLEYKKNDKLNEDWDHVALMQCLESLASNEDSILNKKEVRPSMLIFSKSTTLKDYLKDNLIKNCSDPRCFRKAFDIITEIKDVESKKTRDYTNLLAICKRGRNSESENTNTARIVQAVMPASTSTNEFENT